MWDSAKKATHGNRRSCVSTNTFCTNRFGEHECCKETFSRWVWLSKRNEIVLAPNLHWSIVQYFPASWRPWWKRSRSYHKTYESTGIDLSYYFQTQPNWHSAWNWSVDAGRPLRPNWNRMLDRVSLAVDRLSSFYWRRRNDGYCIEFVAVLATLWPHIHHRPNRL